MPVGVFWPASGTGRSIGPGHTSPVAAGVPRPRTKTASCPVSTPPSLGALTAPFWQEGASLREPHGRRTAVLVAALATIILDLGGPGHIQAMDPAQLSRF